MTTIRVERILPASAVEVFAAWTDPASMARWLSPAGHAEVEADVRVNGRFRVVMVGDDARIEHTGEYLDVDPPRLIRFTWRSVYTGNRRSVVTVQLHSDGDTTRVVLTHEELPDDTAASHEGGWGSILDRLAGELEGKG